jgi:hypothetical protein
MALRGAITAAPGQLRTWKNPNASPAEQELAKKGLKSGLINGTAAGVDLGNQVSTFAQNFGGAANVAPGFSATVGAMTTVQSGAGAVDAHQKLNALNDTLKSLDYGNADNPNRQAADDIHRNSPIAYQKLNDATTFAVNQMERKRLNAGAGAVSGAVTTVGGVLTATGIAAGPGAVMTAVGGGGSALLGLKKAAHYIQKGANGQVGNLREGHAKNLMDSLGLQPPRPDDNRTRAQEKRYAEQIVRALGLNPNDLRTNPEAGQKLIEDQLASW